MTAGLQGNVLRAYGCTDARFTFARIADPVATRAWIGRTLPRITWHADGRDGRPAETCNVGVSAAGLRALGVPAERIGSELSAFGAGMLARAATLGEDPSGWKDGLVENHVVVVTGSWGGRPGGAGLFAGCGLQVRHIRDARLLPAAREHFGFGDGFSQPAIAGVGGSPRRGEGTKGRFGIWRDIALGEFVLGHVDEGGACSPAPAGPLGVDSTFMVVRQLEQDVAGFRSFVAREAQRLGRSTDWLGSRLIGRWPNGSPVVRYPDRPGPTATRAGGAFGYAGDPTGHACPLGAHVRRANPRDGLGWGGRPTQRHRLLRRGMAYGPALPDGVMKPDGAQRGLMFVSFQASLERQFEFIQRQWLGDGNVFGLGDDRDPLFAVGGSGQVVIQGVPPRYLSGLPAFVANRGGDYFLYPGRAGLEALANGTE